MLTFYPCQMRDLEERTRKCRQNADEVVRIMSRWNDAPMLTRKDGKSTEPLMERADFLEASQRRWVPLYIVGSITNAPTFNVYLGRWISCQVEMGDSTA